MKKRKFIACASPRVKAASCPCPEDCPRRGSCCECIEFHSALGEVPYCVSSIINTGAKCSAGGPVSAKKAASPECLKENSPGFKLINFASCAG